MKKPKSVTSVPVNLRTFLFPLFCITILKRDTDDQLIVNVLPVDIPVNG